jgi:MFS family permease
VACHPQAVRDPRHGLNRVRRRLGAPLRPYGAVFANKSLRQLELAWAGSIFGQWAYEVALAVFTYRAGGAAAVGLVSLMRLLPAGIAAPFAAALGDRFQRVHIMIAADLARVAAMASAAAVAFAGGPAEGVYALASVAAITGTAFQPAQSALLPALARTPEELTAANLTSTTLESVGFFAGPAFGGLLLAATSAGVVFATTAFMFLWSALMISRLRVGEDRGHGAVAHGILRETLTGFREVVTERGLRLVVGLYGAQTLVAGIMRVLLVVTALRLLDLGASGVGFLNAAVGVGALVGILIVAARIGRTGLAAEFGLGILLWGVPLVLLGAWPNVAAALVFFGMLGLGNTLVDVAGFTLLQRTAREEVRARVFGVLESVFMTTIGVGAIIAPALTSAFGVRAALIATGAALVAVVIPFWRSLTRIDATVTRDRDRELSLIRQVPIFASLPPLAVEQLAASLVPMRIPAGAEVFRSGDPGNRFYIIAEGEAEIVVDGRPILGRGDYFGEIALLRNVPRTATVTARTDLELYALERDEFIAAVTGHALSAEAANAVIASRLGVGTGDPSR